MKTNYWKNLGIPAVVATRLILPLFLWKNVFVVYSLIFLVDWFDGEIFRKAFSHGKNKVYQLFDKTLDFYGYCFAFAFSYTRASPILGALLFFFVLRAAGMVVFLVKRDRRVFLYFPNLFENFFILYIIAYTFPSLHFLLNGTWFYLIFLAIVVFTVVREYVLHGKKFSFYKYFTGKRWV